MDPRYIKSSLHGLASEQQLSLVRLVEEAAEVQKAATKILRFGFIAIDEVDRTKSYNNLGDLVQEMEDLNRAFDTLRNQTRKDPRV